MVPVAVHVKFNFCSILWHNYHTEIWSFKDNGITSLTFWGHVTSSVTWPLDSAYVVFYWWPIGTMRLSARIRRYGASKIFGSRVWPFGVTWRHLSRDHSTRHM